MTCITLDVFELRPCLVTGAHRSTCDGRGRRREILERYDPETRQTIRAHVTRILDTPCEGCLPRSAVAGGRVCEPHARKITDGINRLPDLAAHLWSVNRSGSAEDGVRVAHGSTMPIPSSRLLLRDLLEAASKLLEAALEPGGISASSLPPLLTISAYDSVVDVVDTAVEVHSYLALAGDMVWKRARPARRAVEFARLAGIAYRAFPAEDAPHRIPALRCRTCGRLALEWHPPLYYLDDDSIRCGVCSAVEDRSLYEHDVAVILAARAGRNTR